MNNDEQTAVVQAMQDYIEAHVFDVVTPAALSRISGYSPWYAARLFRQMLDMTPAEYIRRLRLSKSALRLRDEKVRILDAAYESGFESVDGYQRAFFREFGCNPREYAQNPIPIWLFQPYGVKFKRPETPACAMPAGTAKFKETDMDTVQTVFVQTVEKPARKVLIKRGVKAADYFSYCDEVGCDIWGMLTSIKSIGSEPVSMWLPRKYIAAGTSEYVQGAEVEPDYRGVVPEGFDVISLPAATYLMFRGEPFKDENFSDAITCVWNAIGRFDPTVTGWEWDPGNPKIQLEPRGERGYIELRPVKRK